MNCRNEPGYPLLTVVFCLNAPYLTAHLPTNRCGLQAPHSTEICGEWAQPEQESQCSRKLSAERELTKADWVGLHATYQLGYAIVVHGVHGIRSRQTQRALQHLFAVIVARPTAQEGKEK